MKGLQDIQWRSRISLRKRASIAAWTCRWKPWADLSGFSNGNRITTRPWQNQSICMKVKLNSRCQKGSEDSLLQLGMKSLLATSKLIHNVSSSLITPKLITITLRVCTSRMDSWDIKDSIRVVHIIQIVHTIPKDLLILAKTDQDEQEC